METSEMNMAAALEMYRRSFAFEGPRQANRGWMDPVVLSRAEAKAIGPRLDEMGVRWELADVDGPPCVPISCSAGSDPAPTAEGVLGDLQRRMGG